MTDLAKKTEEAIPSYSNNYSSAPSWPTYPVSKNSHPGILKHSTDLKSERKQAHDRIAKH